MENMENNGNAFDSQLNNLENIQEGGGNDTPGLLKHVFNFDKKTKNILLNTIQYLVILLIPLKLTDKLLDYLFENQVYSNRNTFVILAECLVEIIIMVIIIFIIHRFIIYIPTYSGTAISNINLIHIAIMVAFSKLHNNERFKTKIDYIVNKLNDEISPKDEKKVGNVYNPLQNNNNNVMPRHIPSEINNQNIHNSHNTLRSLEHTAIEQSQNQINNNNISLGLLPQQSPNMTQPLSTSLGINNINNQIMEPEAANNTGSGFSSW